MIPTLLIESEYWSLRALYDFSTRENILCLGYDVVTSGFVRRSEPIGFRFVVSGWYRESGEPVFL